MLIGEVARRSGVGARMLRHVRRIFYVEGLRSLGLSLREVARTLDDPGFTPSALVGDLIRETGQRLKREHEGPPPWHWAHGA